MLFCTECPQRKGVHRDLWPGSPDGVVNSTVYTYSHETNSCNVNYKLSWIPPNDGKYYSHGMFVVH